MLPNILWSCSFNLLMSFLLWCFQSNASKLSGHFCEDKICAGKIGKVGYAPILLIVIVVLMILFLNSVVAGRLCSSVRCILSVVRVNQLHYVFCTAPKLPKVTAVVGLWCWTAISLAFGSVWMFYRCSRYIFHLLVIKYMSLPRKLLL